MRITGSMITNKYKKNLNSSAYKMNYLNEKVTSGRKFFKGSEDPISAIKAYKLRREYRETEMYDTNISDTDSFLTTAEINLTEINDNLSRIYTSYLRGVNGTMSSDEREIVAKEIDNIQESMLNSLNSKISDRYVFGGTSKDEIPFTVDTNGDLLYKGISVDDNANQINLDALASENLNIDLGLGMKFDGSGELIKDTTFDLSMSGIKIMGYGTATAADGVTEIPNNLYSLVGKIKDQLRDPNYSYDNISQYIGKFETQKTSVLISVADIGTKTKYLDFLKTRNEDTQLSLNEKIDGVEHIDTADAIIDFKMQEYSYNAALSMGNKILQNSFIDFMR
ncbi:flagellar hook-associated protein 3 FlgL [Sedimentibacter acidaminivorans]|uniref:Flagellar hook-associated protein 3 FlgL n=1 Tax=Sedimentibacter acidaminivorans TaxID=913099 RepID=A0ABS4GDI5_9FIRM|nr:hypothetical protein [Sedimentibacter acidaminivorans]MBP1925762.1 flagellar hook-associated protein 3 FlgL [Sedimentibacter acidaminivorans]